LSAEWFNKWLNNEITEIGVPNISEVIEFMKGEEMPQYDINILHILALALITEARFGNLPTHIRKRLKKVKRTWRKPQSFFFLWSPGNIVHLTEELSIIFSSLVHPEACQRPYAGDYQDFMYKIAAPAFRQLLSEIASEYTADRNPYHFDNDNGKIAFFKWRALFINPRFLPWSDNELLQMVWQSIDSNWRKEHFKEFWQHYVLLEEDLPTALQRAYILSDLTNNAGFEYHSNPKFYEKFLQEYSHLSSEGKTMLRYLIGTHIRFPKYMTLKDYQVIAEMIKQYERGRLNKITHTLSMIDRGEYDFSFVSDDFNVKKDEQFIVGIIHTLKTLPDTDLFTRPPILLKAHELNDLSIMADLFRYYPETLAALLTAIVLIENPIVMTDDEKEFLTAYIKNDITAAENALKKIDFEYSLVLKIFSTTLFKILSINYARLQNGELVAKLAKQWQDAVENDEAIITPTYLPYIRTWEKDEELEGMLSVIDDLLNGTNFAISL